MRPTASSARLPLDQVGLDGVTVLTNGNYVVDSSVLGQHRCGRGDVGRRELRCPRSDQRRRTASSEPPPLDHVGVDGVTALSPNSNYVVGSGDWDNGAAADAGAVTWGDGAAGVPQVQSARATAWSAPQPATSSETTRSASGVTPLTNGNYVVVSPVWSNGGSAEVGAVTWASGTGQHDRQRRRGEQPRRSDRPATAWAVVA